jgi:hypothetical protein
MIYPFASACHGANNQAVAEDDEVGRDGWDARSRQEYPGQVQWIAGGKLDFRRHASRSVALPDRTKGLYGFRQGELLTDEPADEPPASHLASHLHPPILNEEIPPRLDQ